MCCSKQKVEFKMNDLVEVKTKGKGVIKYIGVTSFIPNKLLYGIELENKKGNHNGTYEGQTYFDCKDGHGVFTGILF